MLVHLVVIAWLYVALMMAVAEATHATGTVLGAIITFVMYGLAPVALVMYLFATPARRHARRAREAAEREAAIRCGTPQQASDQPDEGSKTSADAVAAVRKES